ncbi:MAG: bifunctional precorrin-2 dehydrogenase/sirohydrochlorin ferrochelatase [Desulfitobacteriaceae bacterium]|nr:bifunctional precorrin-2 dehydrogenase/sirohydrochlorin ferrochelatase [Desulfitobacteriaceae bacterium]MDI6877833.1 bifunctional precorrin-2 dehydrogenase/sirohydrochlorin ferrochelatase [Desulfitobacteriaceae bacterium]MDI6912766.1 bifunctional precorrin-2 dehydrogenase/sirohydrochlorin ferrochelatase [Desulfitobacteriaceae bacterium]
MSHYYPIFVDLENQPVLVVGGGQVAKRKVDTLLEHGAQVRIVAPDAIHEIKTLAEAEHCVWEKRAYQSTDVHDAVLVFSCTDREEVNAQVAWDARQAGRAVNVVDDPEKCSFIVPSIMERGELCIAVSTGGSSPLVARQIREELETLYGEEMAEYLAILKHWRAEAKQRLPAKERQEFWARVTDGEVGRLVKSGRTLEAKEVVEQCFQSLLA